MEKFRLPGLLANFLPRRWRTEMLPAVLMPFALSLLVGLYFWTQARVTLVLNGQAFHLSTHQTSVEGLLREVGIHISEGDLISPSPEEALRSGRTVTVQQARPVLIEAEGKTFSRRVSPDDRNATLSELLREAGITLRPHDRLFVEGRAALPSAMLSSFPLRTRAGLEGASGPADFELLPLHIALRRAVPINIYEMRGSGSSRRTIHTSALTLGEALNEAGIIIYLGDEVIPSLESPLSSGLEVQIRRARPVEILADGRLLKLRTRKETVAEALAEARVALMGKDRTIPRESERLSDDTLIRVVRVSEEIILEQETVPYETIWRPDPKMEIDQRHLEQEGGDGLVKRQVRIIYEDGKETHREIEDEWAESQPIAKLISYGTRIVPRELETPEGKIRYWRKIRLLATSYTAATSGKSPEHPQYGLTSLGLRAGKGIIAVDPQVINYETKIYVPGYGIGIAGDSGSKIKGRHIDLGYDEGNMVFWYEWVDAYLLYPPPDRKEIRWVLPGWPREPR